VHYGAAVTSDEEQAARLTGGAWQAVLLSGGPRAVAFRHFRAAFDRTWLASLPLPTAGNLRPGQPAAVPGSDGLSFERHDGSAALRAAHEHRPATRIYEDIGWGPDGTRWAALAGQHLTRLADGPRVTATVYESAHGDQELGAHRDTWLGIIVQVDGAKAWHAGEGLPGLPGGAHQVTMTAGDVLILPKNLPHLVTTPADPGHSVHLASDDIKRHAVPGAGADPQVDDDEGPAVGRDDAGDLAVVPPVPVQNLEPAAFQVPDRLPGGGLGERFLDAHVSPPVTAGGRCLPAVTQGRRRRAGAHTGRTRT
jgi:hypothetical protein